MKKTIVSSIIFAIILFVYATVANAATESELANQLYAIGSKYGATAADKVKIERYLADNDVSASDADAIIAKAKEAAAIMDAAGVKDPKQLTAAQKEQIKSIANQAASIAGINLAFTHDGVAVYKNGKLIDVVSGTSGTTTTKTTTAAKTSGSTASTSAGLTQRRKLAYTGGNTKVIVISGVVAGIALVSVLIRKKVVNA